MGHGHNENTDFHRTSWNTRHTRQGGYPDVPGSNSYSYVDAYARTTICSQLVTYFTCLSMAAHSVDALKAARPSSMENCDL